LSEGLWSWKYKRTTMATELALDSTDREALVMAFSLQDITCDHTARDVVGHGSQAFGQGLAPGRRCDKTAMQWGRANPSLA
jgi:hypothetical protein